MTIVHVKCATIYENIVEKYNVESKSASKLKKGIWKWKMTFFPYLGIVHTFCDIVIELEVENILKNWFLLDVVVQIFETLKTDQQDKRNWIEIQNELKWRKWQKLCQFTWSINALKNRLIVVFVWAICCKFCCWNLPMDSPAGVSSKWLCW